MSVEGPSSYSSSQVENKTENKLKLDQSISDLQRLEEEEKEIRSQFEALDEKKKKDHDVAAWKQDRAPVYERYRDVLNKKNETQKTVDELTEKVSLDQLHTDLDWAEGEAKKIASEQEALNKKKEEGGDPNELESEQSALNKRREEIEKERDLIETHLFELNEKRTHRKEVVDFFTPEKGVNEEEQKKIENDTETQKKQAVNAKVNASSANATPTPKEAKGKEEKDEKKKGRMAQWWDKVGHIYTEGDNDEAGNEMALIMMRLLALLALLFKIGKMAGDKVKEVVEEKLADKKGELERKREDLFKQSADLDQQQALHDAKIDLFQQVQDDALGDDELEELFAMSKGAPPVHEKVIEEDEGIEVDPLVYEEEEFSPPVYQQSTVSNVEHAVPQHAVVTEQPDLSDDDGLGDEIEDNELGGENIEGEMPGQAVPPLTQGSKVEALQAQITSPPEASSTEPGFIEQDEEERNKNKEDLLNAARGVAGALGNLLDQAKLRKDITTQTEADLTPSPSNAEAELASLEKNLFSAELPEEDNSQKQKLLAATKDVADKTADLLKGINNRSAEAELASLEKNLFSAELPEEDNSQKEKLLAATKDVADKTADLLKGINNRSAEATATESRIEPAFPEEEKVITQLRQSPDWPQEGRVKELVEKHEGFIAEAGKALNSEEVRAKEAAKAIDLEGSKPSQKKQVDEQEPIKAELGAKTPKPTLSAEAELASLEKNLFSAELPKEDNSQKENLLAATKQVADATANLLKQVPDRPEASTEKNIEQKVESQQSQPQTEAEAAAPSPTPKRRGGQVAGLIEKHKGFIEEAGKDLNSQQVQEKDTKKVLSQSLEEQGMGQPEKVAGMVMDFSKKMAANFVASNEGVSPPEQNFQMMMKAILSAATVKKDSEEHQKVSGNEKENKNPNSMDGMGDGQGMGGMDAQALGGEDMASEATMGVGPKDIEKLQNGSKAEKAEVAGKMAATAMGIPPPANAMVGEACGKAVEKMDSMNPKNQIEGVTATMGEIAQGIAAETADGGAAAPASSEEQAGSEFGKLLGNLTASTIKVTTDVVTKGFSGAMSAPGNEGPDPAAEKKGGFTPGANAHQSSATSKKDFVAPQPQPQPEATPAQEPSSKPSAKPASH